MQVPAHYIEGACADNIPADQPVRRMLCGMMRAVDESVKNISDTYKVSACPLALSAIVGM